MKRLSDWLDEVDPPTVSPTRSSGSSSPTTTVNPGKLLEPDDDIYRIRVVAGNDKDDTPERDRPTAGLMNMHLDLPETTPSQPILALPDQPSTRPSINAPREDPQEHVIDLTVPTSTTPTTDFERRLALRRAAIELAKARKQENESMDRLVNSRARLQVGGTDTISRRARAR